MGLSSYLRNCILGTKSVGLTSHPFISNKITITSRNFEVCCTVKSCKISDRGARDSSPACPLPVTTLAEKIYVSRVQLEVWIQVFSYRGDFPFGVSYVLRPQGAYSTKGVVTGVEDIPLPTPIHSRAVA